MTSTPPEHDTDESATDESATDESVTDESVTDRTRDKGESVTDHDHDTHEPITDRVHDNSWSANLEQPEHAADRDRLVEQALSAVEHTAAGNHVNLVTHGTHGHPETYLYDALHREYGDELDWEYVEQCGCGGHVVRAYVE